MPTIKIRKRLARLVLAALVAVVVPLAAGAAPLTPLTPGAPQPALALEDQNGKLVRVDADTRIVIFTAEMAVGDFVKEVLRAQAPGTLDRLHAVYFSDISAMPALITRMVALPKLRELPFSIGLGRDAAHTADLPRQAGAASVLQLAGGKIAAIVFVKDAAELRQAIGLK